MNKAELIEALAQRSGLQKQKAKNWGGSSGTNIFRNVCRCISEVAVICCL